jgi:predicted secreted acid phosphatase
LEPEKSPRCASGASLLNQALAKNVHVFFITGRNENPDRRAATTENLEKVGYAGWKKLIMRVEAVGCDVTCFKRQARADVAKDHTIIGDQWSDLDPLVNDTTKGSQAERIFKLPNPFYFIP